VARDAPFYDPSITEEMVANISRFACEIGALEGEVRYDGLVATQSPLSGKGKARSYTNPGKTVRHAPGRRIRRQGSSITLESFTEELALKMIHYPKMFRLLILFASAVALVSACTSREHATVAAAPQEAFALSYAAGSRDDAGRFMGGTEMRVLAAHGGKLYAGNGYWEDRPGPEGLQGAEVLVLGSPGARWRVDHVFDEQLPDGRRRDLAVSALEEVTFTTDGHGAQLPAPVSMLIAANWDLSGTARVFSRDDATGTWTAAATIAQDRPTMNFLPQVHSFGRHRDRVAGIDRVFAGQDPRGIFSGTFDPAVTGRLRWDAAPELELSGVSTAGLSGRNGYLRVSSFAECNGRLYAAVGQQIYERVDGAAPHWRLLYTNRYPGHSETGLRGLTVILGPSGHREVLLAAVEGSVARIVRVDPRDGSEVTEVDLPDLLGRQWGMPVGYVIAAYNEMAKVPDPDGGEALLIGLEAFIPMRAPIAAGHSVVNVGYGRLEAGGWYLVRHPTGSYELRQVGASPSRALVAIRAIRVSPFPEEGQAVYFAGYDANKAPAHDTAWIFRSTTAAPTTAQPR
jgi:hypothetical protein